MIIEKEKAFARRICFHSANYHQYQINNYKHKRTRSAHVMYVISLIFTEDLEMKCS